MQVLVMAPNFQGQSLDALPIPGQNLNLNTTGDGNALLVNGAANTVITQLGAPQQNVVIGVVDHLGNSSQNTPPMALNGPISASGNGSQPLQNQQKFFICRWNE
jgi:hypothetical protein